MFDKRNGVRGSHERDQLSAVDFPRGDVRQVVTIEIHTQHRLYGIIRGADVGALPHRGKVRPGAAVRGDQHGTARSRLRPGKNVQEAITVHINQPADVITGRRATDPAEVPPSVVLEDVRRLRCTQHDVRRTIVVQIARRDVVAIIAREIRDYEIREPTIRPRSQQNRPAFVCPGRTVLIHQRSRHQHDVLAPIAVHVHGGQAIRFAPIIAEWKEKGFLERCWRVFVCRECAA